MQHLKQPIIHKAPVAGLAVNITKTGLCLNDPAYLRLEPDGRITIHARRNTRLFGIFTRNRPVLLGHFGPTAQQILTASLNRGDSLRVRIVGLTPEHLAGPSGPEVHVSVWGDLHQLMRGNGPLAGAPTTATTS